MHWQAPNVHVFNIDPSTNLNYVQDFVLFIPDDESDSDSSDDEEDLEEVTVTGSDPDPLSSFDR